MFAKALCLIAGLIVLLLPDSLDEIRINERAIVDVR